MARKKKFPEPEGIPPWLITFTDMMTLMLTFFVLLVSMSTIDERRRLIVLGSIIGTFGIGEAGFDPRTATDTRATVEPGAMEDVEDLEVLKQLLWEDLQNDLDFQSNKFLQILSINDQVLFEPGEVELTPRGQLLLDRILPVLLEIEHPLLLGGHTSTPRAEDMEREYVYLDQDPVSDPTWKLSLYRVMAIYRYLVDRGMSPDMLKMEAFGRFHPRFSDQTPEGRERNRRVDIVLDTRNSNWFRILEQNQRSRMTEDGEYNYNGYRFQVDPTEGE